MAYVVLPSVRSRKTRATTSSGVDLGLPRTTPWSLRTASASRVRLRMKSRSSPRGEAIPGLLRRAQS